MARGAIPIFPSARSERGENFGSLCRKNADDGVLRWAPGGISVTTLASDVFGFVASRDGRWAAYFGVVLYAVENQGLFAAPVEGAAPIQLAPLSTFTYAFLVAARGANVAYFNRETGQLLLRDLDSSAAPIVLADGELPISTPFAATENGDTLVYVVERTDAGQHGLFAMGVP
jgi:hypothetical protein